MQAAEPPAPAAALAAAPSSGALDAPPAAAALDDAPRSMRGSKASLASHRSTLLLQSGVVGSVRGSMQSVLSHRTPPTPYSAYRSAASLRSHASPRGRIASGIRARTAAASPRYSASRDLIAEEDSNPAVQAMLVEHLRQHDVLETAIASLEDALDTIAAELHATRHAGVAFPAERGNTMDSAVASGESLTTTPSSAISSEEYAGNGSSNYYLTDSMIEAMNDGEDDFSFTRYADGAYEGGDYAFPPLVDHDDLVQSAIDAGSPNMLILPYIAPIPSITKAAPPQGPVFTAFPARTSRTAPGGGAPPSPPARIREHLDAASEDALASLRGSRTVLPPRPASPRGLVPRVVPIAAEPASVQFTNYTPGTVYAARVDILNRSLHSLAVGIHPGSPLLRLASVFHLTPRTPVRLAPGMRIAIHILFRPDSLANYAAAIDVQYQGATTGTLTVPVAAHRPPPVLAWPDAVDLPACPARKGASVMQVRRLVNEGGAGSFTLTVVGPGGGGAPGTLAVSPASFYLGPGNHANLTLTYTDAGTVADPNSLPELVEFELEIHCDNGATRTSVVAVARVPPEPALELSAATLVLAGFPGTPACASVTVTNPTPLPVAYAWGPVAMDEVVLPDDDDEDNVGSGDVDATLAAARLAHLDADRIGASASQLIAAADRALDTAHTAAAAPSINIAPRRGVLAPGASVVATVTSTAPRPLHARAHVRLLASTEGDDIPVHAATLSLTATVAAIAIDVHPPRVSVPGTLRVGASHTSAVTVTNRSAASVPLRWWIENVPEHILRCRVVDAKAETPLAPGETRTVALDLRGAWPGAVNGCVIVEQAVAGDPAGTVAAWQQRVPVQVVVDAADALVQVSPPSVEFGPLALGETQTATVTLTNADPLRRALDWRLAAVPLVTHTQTTHAVFRSDPAAGVLAPGASVAVRVQCIPVRPVDALRGTVQCTAHVHEARGHAPAAEVAAVVPFTLTAVVPRIEVREDVALDPVWVGAPRSVPVEITNPTRAPVQVAIRTVTAGDDLEFDLSSRSVAIPGGATAVIDVVATCSRAGPVLADLILTVPGAEPAVVRVRGTAVHPALTCDTATLDYGPLALFGWTERRVVLTNASPVPVEFMAAPECAARGPAWTDDDEAAVVPRKGVPHADTMALAQQAWSLANGERGAAFAVFPPWGTVPAGASVEVGVWAVATAAGDFARTVTLHHAGGGTLSIPARVSVRGSPVYVATPRRNPASGVVQLGASPTVPLEITNIAPFSVTAHIGILAWHALTADERGAVLAADAALAAGRMPAAPANGAVAVGREEGDARFDHPAVHLDPALDPPRIELPPATTRVVHLFCHGGGGSGADASPLTHGVLLLDLAAFGAPWITTHDDGQHKQDGGWRATVARGREQGAAGPAFDKRAVLAWARAVPHQAVYLTSSPPGGPRKDDV
ncbi:hypothetical protein H9P43_000274 [Blastocladiella emersonii ATCC 22665]|nr:hypothetical protein H9P43_000274 [Blastocladiella emersonii ATCC 22665]